jgi:ankyrin repeat protein
MMASWLGQRTVVERLLDGGGDINARSESYGTALTIAAVRKDVELTRVLVQRNSVAFLGTKAFKILNTRRSELLSYFDDFGLDRDGCDGDFYLGYDLGQVIEFV